MKTQKRLNEEKRSIGRTKIIKKIHWIHDQTLEKIIKNFNSSNLKKFSSILKHKIKSKIDIKTHVFFSLLWIRSKARLEILALTKTFPFSKYRKFPRKSDIKRGKANVLPIFRAIEMDLWLLYVEAFFLLFFDLLVLSQSVRGFLIKNPSS